MKFDLSNCIAWYLGKSTTPIPDNHCTSRDQFQGRLDHLLKELIALKWSINEASLLVSIAGELGNNCFDHNLGHWMDQPGCYFQKNFDKNLAEIIIADRGQGVLNSLKHADNTLADDQTALSTAFSKIISGRFPEKRGNGLKFVRNVINGDKPRGLSCRSGSGHVSFGSLGDASYNTLSELIGNNVSQGTLTHILWRTS